jgi:ADP-ribose pyrophosphatase
MTVSFGAPRRRSRLRYGDDDVFEFVPLAMTGWLRVSSRVVSEAPVHLDEDVVRTPEGEEIVYQVVRARGFACVCPVTPDGRVALVRQYRYPLDDVTCELPAGAIEDGETPLETAKRETAEEASLTADEWIHLGSFWTMPGKGDERAHLFLASDARPLAPTDDQLEVVFKTFDAALAEAVSVRDALCLRLAREAI